LEIQLRDVGFITIAASVDFIVQIRIIHEVRRVVKIAHVERELRDGQPWCTPVFRFNENSPVDAPRWERVSAAEVGQE